MTTTVFPAQPGTFMIERDPSDNSIMRIPVIGWQHIQGNLAYPVCVMSHNGLTHNKAILHPEGYVTDAIHRAVFGTLDEWLNFMKTAKSTNRVLEAPLPYDPTTQPYDEPNRHVDAADRARQAASMPDDTPKARPGPAPAPKATPSFAITFGTKSFKTKSFWQCEAGVFTIDGGQPYPKDERCAKITRDEYDNAKRAGAKVIDPRAAADEDDDDGMDLV